MSLNALKIDPEFQGKIPPLTFEELEQLEKNMESLKNAAAIDEDELKAAVQLFKKERYEVHRL